MERTVTRQIMDKRGNGVMQRFTITGLSSGRAARVADMLKFNLEFDKGLHTDKHKKYKKGDFEQLGEYDVVVPA